MSDQTALKQIDLDEDEALTLASYISAGKRPVTLVVSDGRAGYGLYAFDTEYPDEGAEFIAALDATPQAAPSLPSTLPEGVYYSSEHDNFYKDDCGMGEDFYIRWRDRRHDFPSNPQPKPASTAAQEAPQLTDEQILQIAADHEDKPRSIWAGPQFTANGLVHFARALLQTKEQN